MQLDVGTVLAQSAPGGSFTVGALVQGSQSIPSGGERGGAPVVKRFVLRMRH